MSATRRALTGGGSPASKVLDQIMGRDPGLRKAIREQKLNFLVAEMIQEARTSAKLSQVQLAKLVGTAPSVISRLEDADHEGHSLTMLQRIAEALQRKLVVKMVPADRVNRTRSPQAR